MRQTETIEGTPQQLAEIERLRTLQNNAWDRETAARAEMYRAQNEAADARTERDNIINFLKFIYQGNALTWIKSTRDEGFDSLTNYTWYTFYAASIRFQVTTCKRTDVTRAPFYICVSVYKGSSGYHETKTPTIKKMIEENANGYPYGTPNSILRRYKTEAEQAAALVHFQRFLIDEYNEQLINNYAFMKSIRPDTIDRAAAIADMMTIKVRPQEATR